MLLLFLSPAEVMKQQPDEKQLAMMLRLDALMMAWPASSRGDYCKELLSV